MSQFIELVNEFKNLKSELFKDGNFVVLDQTDFKVRRYNQLLGYFYPQFRTTDWESPVQVIVMEINDCGGFTQQIVKGISESVKPCDGSVENKKPVHKFSCSRCRKYTCIPNSKTGDNEHYCFGRKVASKAVNWLKIVGCASFRDDVSGHNEK